jgi:2-C-methyl-D-erythritol 4-phosphate cytidylyltransferase
MASPRTAVVVLAAGSGTRVGAEVNKVLLPLAGWPAVVWSVRTALEVDGVHRLLLVVRPEDRPGVEEAVAPHLGSHDVWLVDGGETRHASETNALDALRADIEGGEIDVVAIHDAARPLATAGLWARTIAAAAASGGALPVLRQHGLVPRDPGVELPAEVVGVQTPQAFRARPLLAAYDAAARDGFTGTDTAACLERYVDLSIVGVPGEPANLKVTWAEDLPQAEELLLRRARR